MKNQYSKLSLTALVAVGFVSLANISALAAELTGTVQGAKQPIAGSTVTHPLRNDPRFQELITSSAPKAANK
jgi:hypothetical protein